MANLRKLEGHLRRHFPYFAPILEARGSDFGEVWAQELDRELDVLFGDAPARLESAVVGYGKFALDSMRLQKKFDRLRRYEPKSYAEASSAVYMNENYMQTLYLPGILLSHYLWPHHYRQLGFFRREFLPIMMRSEAPRFLDVGVGTGFYSKEILTRVPTAVGKGLDISPHARAYALSMMAAWGVSDRYGVELCDVVESPPVEAVPFMLSVEVIEHLEDPRPFLHALRGLLRPEGRAFVATALTAPNADHIYLFNDVSEVIRLLEQAGFGVERFEEHAGYPPRREGEAVPRVAAFIACGR